MPDYTTDELIAMIDNDPATADENLDKIRGALVSFRDMVKASAYDDTRERHRLDDCAFAMRRIRETEAERDALAAQLEKIRGGHTCADEIAGLRAQLAESKDYADTMNTKLCEALRELSDWSGHRQDLEKHAAEGWALAEKSGAALANIRALPSEKLKSAEEYAEEGIRACWEGICHGSEHDAGAFWSRRFAACQRDAIEKAAAVEGVCSCVTGTETGDDRCKHCRIRALLPDPPAEDES